MAGVRKIQRNVTRPTSVAIMLVLFQGFQLMFPDKMSPQWQDWTLNTITVIGGTGLIDKIFRNWNEISEFFKNLLTKKIKQNEKFKRGTDLDSQGS